MLDQIGGGGFAVGASDANQVQALGRTAVEIRCGKRKRFAGVGNDYLGDIGRVCEVHLALDDEDLRPAIDGVLGEGMAVNLRADNAEESISWPYPVAAECNAGNLFGFVSDDRAVDTGKQLLAGNRHEALLTRAKSHND